MNKWDSDTKLSKNFKLKEFEKKFCSKEKKYR